MPKVKTIELTGTETAVTFPQNYPHYMILNMGDSEVCASGNPGIVPYADGVYSVPAGAEIRISPEASGDTIWLLGIGRVQVRAEEIAAQTSFKSRGKGGDGDSGAANYELLSNKPSIGGVELSGNKTWSELNLPSSSPQTDNSTITVNAADKLSAVSIKGNFISGNSMTIGSLKQSIFQWWSNLYPGEIGGNGSRFAILTFRAKNLIANWNNDNYNMSYPDKWYQLIPISAHGLMYGSPVSGAFLLSCMQENSVYLLTETYRNEFSAPIKIATLNDISRFLPAVTEITDSAADDNVPTSKAVQTLLEKYLKRAFDDILVVSNKTIAELKQAILDWDSANRGYFSVFRFSGSTNTDSVVDHWDDDDWVIPPGNVWQITPICFYDQSSKHSVYLLSTVTTSGDKIPLTYKFSRVQDSLVGFEKIYNPDNGYGISDSSLDWNLLTATGTYTIGFDGGITEESHGPVGVSSWGILTVTNTGVGTRNPACIIQKYAVITSGIYWRSKWNLSGDWSSWYKISSAATGN